MNMLLGGKDSGHGNPGSNPLGNISGLMGSGNYNSHGSGGGGGKNPLGKIGGALASSLLNTGGKPEQPDTFHGGPVSGQQQPHGGLAGSIMGGVANMFGGGSSQTQGVSTYYPPSRPHNLHRDCLSNVSLADS